MLVFCEDCGGKNILEPARIETKKYQYRCSACNFLNTYQPKKQTPSAPNQIPVPLSQETQTEKKSKATQTLNSTAGYKVKKKRRQLNCNKESYRKVFQESVTIPDIIGIYEYHFSEGLLAYDVAAEITDQTMMQIGKAFSVCSPYGHKILKNTKEIYLVLDYVVAVSRNLNTHSILVFLCKSYPLQARAAKVFDTTCKKLQSSK